MWKDVRVFCCTELSAGGEKYLFLHCSGEEFLCYTGASRNPNCKFLPALKQNWPSSWNFSGNGTRQVPGSESQFSGITISTSEVLLEAPASLQWCRDVLSGSAAVTKTFFYLLRVNSAHALFLVLCFPGLREAEGNCGGTQRGQEVAKAGWWSRMEEFCPNGDEESSQCGFALPKEGLAAVSLNSSNLRQSWIHSGTELKNGFSSLDNSFDGFADPCALTNILDNVRRIDDYA